ncbi:MAG TPA: hypothetical protein VHF26_03795 [Trebonia sp.]|nr:hypothetical protein [Trebonia sp.]
MSEARTAGQDSAPEDSAPEDSAPEDGAPLDRTPDIVCELGDEKAAGQEARWRRLGREAGLGRTETTSGLEIRFRGEPAAERELRDLVDVESRCCAWARWEVRRAGDELVLEVSSSPEGAAALHAMFAAGAAPAGGSAPTP